MLYCEQSLTFCTRIPAMPSLDPHTPVTARKQPKQRRALATVGIILDAAAHILETQGFEGYTTNAIAERAGISIGSCYQYFPGKEAIATALIARETAQLVAALEQAGQARSWQEGIGQAVAAAVAYQLHRPRLARQLDQAEFVLKLDAMQASTQTRARSVVITLLGCEGAPVVQDPELASADVVAMAHGMIESAGQRGETDAEALQRRVLRALSGYLGTEG